MFNIQRKYRNLYESEDVVMQRVYESGQWTQTIETVPNAVVNNQISNMAVVFGNGLSRLDFDINLAINHKGGLLGADKLQTYGCNALFRDYTVDFLVALHRDILIEIDQSGYYESNIVYTRVNNTFEFPKKFYMIPYDPYADAGTTALYIAAFDGHKKIFMIGFDGQSLSNSNNNVYAGTNGYSHVMDDVSSHLWAKTKAQLFKIYDDVDFILVTAAGRSNTPEEWAGIPNFRQISHRDFVLEVSL